MIRSNPVNAPCSGWRLPITFFFLIHALMLALVFSDLAQAVEPPLPVAELNRSTPVDYATEILPLLKQNCLACHHAKEAEGGLVMETIETILQGGDTGPALVSGKSAESLLFTRAVGGDEPLMPPEDNGVGAKALNPEQLGLLKLWIDQGAKVGMEEPVESIKWQPIPESIRTVYSLDIAPDGNFAVVGRGNRVVVIDTDTHEISGRLVDPSLDVGEVTDVDLIQSVAVSPQADLIATGGFRTVRLWRRASQSILSDNVPFTNAVGLMAIHGNQDLVAVVNAIGDIEIWSLQDQKLKITLRGNAEKVVDLIWSDSNDSLISIYRIPDMDNSITSTSNDSGLILGDFYRSNAGAMLNFPNEFIFNDINERYRSCTRSDHRCHLGLRQQCDSSCTGDSTQALLFQCQTRSISLKLKELCFTFRSDPDYGCAVG